MKVLDFVLSADVPSAPMGSMAAWWERCQVAVAGASAPIDRAILGGFAADRVGYAFAAGYQAALRALAPDLPPDRIASLCVTERGGGHPRAIETRLTPAAAGARLDGSKRWATLSDAAGV